MAIDPKNLISVDRIINLKSQDKAEVLNELIDVLSSADVVTDKDELRQKIFEREEAVSTGVGAGMAIPHVKISTIRNFVAAIGRSKQGVDFHSLDGKPTHIIVMIGCNSSQSADFLKVLARLVTRLKQPNLQEKILNAKTKEEIRALFVEGDGVLT